MKNYIEYIKENNVDINDLVVKRGHEDHLHYYFYVYLDKNKIGQYNLSEEGEYDFVNHKYKNMDLWLNGLEIYEEFRGKGFAKLILSYILNQIKKGIKFSSNVKPKKYDYFKLSAKKENDIANNLYKSFGFELFDRSKRLNYYRLKLNYTQYIKEYNNDIDPYNEENWEEPEWWPLSPSTILPKYTEIMSKDMAHKGIVLEQRPNPFNQDIILGYLVRWGNNLNKEYVYYDDILYKPKGKVIKIRENIDPYNEEIWANDIFDINGKFYEMSDEPISIDDYFVWEDALEAGPQKAVSMDQQLRNGEIPIDFIGKTGKKLIPITENMNYRDHNKYWKNIYENFLVGDEVICSFSKNGKQYNDEKGVLRYMNEKEYIGIEFDSDIDGHTGGGAYLGEDGHCWNFSRPWHYDLRIEKEDNPKVKWYYKGKLENYSINERLGVSDIVYETAKDIYYAYNLNKYEGAYRVHPRIKIPIDTSQLREPFNKMEITLVFKETKRPKHVHGAMERMDDNKFELYIFQHCNNIPRTLAHELKHIYQIYLRKKDYRRIEGTPSALKKSEESPTLMSIYTQLNQRGVTSHKDFMQKLQALPKYKKYVKILDNDKETKRNKDIALKMIKKMHKMYDLFTESVDAEPLSTKPDIKINVEGKNGIIDRLIDNLTLVVKKRRLNPVRIKSIAGHINKETFIGRGYVYETKLEVLLSNKDVILGEYKSRDNNIMVKINGNIIYDIEHKSFDNEILVDKMVGEYKKYLKNKKFIINEKIDYIPGSNHKFDARSVIDILKKYRYNNKDIGDFLYDSLKNKTITFYYLTRDYYGNHVGGRGITTEIRKVYYNGDLFFTTKMGGEFEVDMDMPIIIYEGEQITPPATKIRWYHKGKLE